MSDITISYKGSSIATMDASGTKTLLTEGKYCEDDITISYTQPSGGGFTLEEFYAKTAPSGDFSFTGTEITGNPFENNSVITKITAPSLTQVSYNNCFKTLSALQYFIAPSCTWVAAGGISYCNNLLGIDTKMDSFGSLAFAGNTKLTTMIIRKSDAICTAGQTNAFNANTITTTKPLNIYVPSTLKSSYESATNWSTWVNEGKIIFHAIEGSTYETHYVDGTTIPT